MSEPLSTDPTSIGIAQSTHEHSSAESASKPIVQKKKAEAKRWSTFTAFHHSASYSELPSRPTFQGLKDVAATSKPTLIRTPSEGDVTYSSQRSVSRQSLEQERSSRQSSNTTGDSEDLTVPRLSRDRRVSTGKASFNKQERESGLTIDSKLTGRRNAKDREGKARSLSGSISNFARTTWIRSSRSSSPGQRSPVLVDKQAPTSGDITTKSSLKDTLDGQKDAPVKPLDCKPDKLQRKTSNRLLNRKGSFTSLLGGQAKNFSRGLTPNVPSIPTSFSTDTLPISNRSQSSTDNLPGIPRTLSGEKLQTLGLEHTRKKDDLWSQFRSLDSDYYKFQSKPSTLKTNHVRATLLPFLRTYREHPSEKHLRAEDLDRRVTILNKWWTGLLELLNGKNGQSVSGNDRPAILEGAVTLMERPEWRLTQASLIARTERKSKSTTSLESMSSDFLAESVLQHVRNLYVQNLIAQMAFVVEKMSIRNVAASVVTFCGKAVAYAFIFCPGVAEVLVRLWMIPPRALQRVLEEYNVTRNESLQSSAEVVVTQFPAHLQPLALRSTPLLIRYLRNPPKLSASLSSIPWHSPWVGRWAGRDSDLFFVFTKHFHIVLGHLWLESTTKLEKVCSPAYILVQAQMLMVLDWTIHRALSIPPPPEPNEGPSNVTFDEMLEADASTIPTPNVVRSMAQNRVIMLLRDFLSDSHTVNDSVRQHFSEVFTNLLKAAARGTSLFDHNACFTLCDFMEEAIAILVRYHESMAFLDWPFWLGVCKKMMESNNSMTDVRLYAFLFGLWGVITDDDGRKGDICLHWLLEEEQFNRQFNHWCPMVRAYFMRLLCWRLARFDGDASETDFAILDMLSSRLKTVWCHYLYIDDQALEKSLHAPSTAPCSPAPGRRLMILRNDFSANTSSVFLTFDAILPSSSGTTQQTAYQRHSSLDPLTQVPSEAQLRSSSPGKKRWSVLKYFTSSIAANDSPSSTSGGNSPSTSPSHSKANNVSSPAQGSTIRPSDSSPAPEPPPKPPLITSPPQSFRFALEWTDRPNAPARNMRLYPPRLPLPAQMYLQSRRPEPHEYKYLEPKGEAVGSSKYSGRALAEWALVVVECQNFFERRRMEGVAGGFKGVECPVLGVEAIRRPG